MTGDSGTVDETSARGSLADVAYERLLAWIMDGTLCAGESIPLGKVAEQLRISQTPLRESLARLEGQGLVVRLPMRGFRVAQPLSPAEVDDLMEARDILEPEIAARAAMEADQADVAGLRAALQRSAEVEVGPRFEDYRDYLDWSARFHELVAQMAGNRFLCEAVSSLPTHLQRFRLFGEGGVDDRDVSLAEHQVIVDAIADGDAAAARDAMRRHIEAVRRRSRAAAADC